MHRILTSVLALAFLTSTASVASAKMCRDSHGKFMKCKAMMMHKKPCRDAHGKFMKCKM
jgi:hypothetical protein